MITIELTDSEAEQLKAVLKMASEEFANHGCNDYPLPRTDQNRELWDRIHAQNFRMTVAEMHAKLEAGDPWITDQYIDCEGEGDIYFMDWMLMGYLAGKVEAAMANGNTQTVEHGAEEVRAWYEEFRKTTGAQWLWDASIGQFEGYAFPGRHAADAFCRFIANKIVETT